MSRCQTVWHYRERTTQHKATTDNLVDAKESKSGGWSVTGLGLNGSIKKLLPLKFWTEFTPNTDSIVVSISGDLVWDDRKYCTLHSHIQS
jgi:hypothetical protein